MSIYELIHIIWHVTNYCNSYCRYCFTSSKYLTKEVSNKLWKLVVSRINREKTIKRVSLIGGEPLLVKELPQIVKNLREDITINIDSNLLLIKGKWNNVYKRAYFCTTIDSIDERIHSITRSHPLKETIEGIKFLLSKKVKVMVVIVVSKHNIETLEKTARFLLDLGVDTIGISRVRMSGRALKIGYHFFYDDIEKVKKKVFDIAERLIKEYGKERILLYNLWFSPQLFELGYSYEPSCKCAIFRACIDWEGYVYPCELMPFYWKKFYTFFKIKRPTVKNMSLKRIFERSKLFRFFRERMMYYPVGCEKCKYRNICNHGCRFYSFLISGTILSKDITCKAESIYDVLGYHHHSPFTRQGKRKWNSETGRYLKEISKKLGNKLLIIGSKGGLWVFFFEDLRKHVVGIENDKTMFLIANEYKNLYHRKVDFRFVEDLLDYDYSKEKFDSALLLDNVLQEFSPDKFVTLIEKLKKTTKIVVVEIDKKSLREETTRYQCNGFVITQITKKLKDNVYRCHVFNEQTGASFTAIYYSWKPSLVEDILKKYGKIAKKETHNSYIYILEFQGDNSGMHKYAQNF